MQLPQHPAHKLVARHAVHLVLGGGRVAVAGGTTQDANPIAHNLAVDPVFERPRREHSAHLCQAHVAALDRHLKLFRRQPIGAVQVKESVQEPQPVVRLAAGKQAHAHETLERVGVPLALRVEAHERTLQRSIRTGPRPELKDALELLTGDLETRRETREADERSVGPTQRATGKESPQRVGGLLRCLLRDHLW